MPQKDYHGGGRHMNASLMRRGSSVGYSMLPCATVPWAAARCHHGKNYTVSGMTHGPARSWGYSIGLRLCLDLDLEGSDSFDVTERSHTTPGDTTTTRRRGGGGIDVKFSWTSDTARRLLHYKSRAAVAAPTLLPPTLPRSIPNAGQVSPPNICFRTPAPKIDIADIYPLDLMDLTLTLNITLTTNTTLTSINPTLTLLP